MKRYGRFVTLTGLGLYIFLAANYCMPHLRAEQVVDCTKVNPYTEPAAWVLCHPPAEEPGVPGLPCNPYNEPVPGLLQCLAYLHTYKFGNVFFNVEGYEGGTFVSVTNEADMLNKILVEVTAPLHATVSRAFELLPNEKPEPYKITEWLELQGVRTGVTVRIRSAAELTVTVAAHPLPGPTYWTGARILEGK